LLKLDAPNLNSKDKKKSRALAGPSHISGYLHRSSSKSYSHTPHQKRPQSEIRSIMIQAYDNEYHPNQVEYSLLYN